MTRNTNQKLRAVFLAALMVLWVFAGAVAFTGSVASQSVEDGTATVSNINAGDEAQTVSDLTVSETESFNGTVYVYANVSTLEEDANVDLSSADVSAQVTDSDNGSAEVASANLNGDLVQIELSIPEDDNNVVTEFTLSNLGTDEAEAASGLSYDVGASEEDTDDPTLGASTGTFDVAEGLHGADATWASANTRWQGQTVLFVDDTGDYSDYQVRELDEGANRYGAQVGSLQREFSLEDGENYATFGSSNLEGDYVITAHNGEQRVALITDSNGNVTGETRDPAGDDAGVEFAVQDLSADFAQDEVNQESVDLEISSNRDDFSVEITSDDFSAGEVNEIFGGAETSDGTVRAGVSSDDTIEADFGQDFVESGNYTFDVQVRDTTASDSANINVGEAIEGGADFDESVYTATRGDNATITLSTQGDVGALNITIGDAEEVGYEAVVEAEPNDDGELVINMNTFQVGERAESGDEADAFTAEEGSINNVTNVGVSLENVIAPGLYDMTVESVARGEDNEPEEFDVAALQIENRDTGELTIHTAPSAEFGSLDDLESLEEAAQNGQVTEAEEIATKESDHDNPRGDVVIFRQDVSGVFGADGLFGDSVNLTLEQQEAGVNRAPKSLDLATMDEGDRTAYRVLTDEENKTVFVVAKVDRLDFNGAPANHGETYNTTFSVSADYLSEFQRNDVEEDETATNEFTVVDREAAFDSDPVTVEPTADATLSGETTVAPGTEFTVRARATGESPFLKIGEATVQEDGSFEATFEEEDSFEGEQPGQEFTVTIPRQSFEDNARTQGQVTEGEEASVSISDVSAQEGEEVDSITVDSAFLPRGGFVTIHDSSLNDGATFDSVRGTSEYLEQGEHEDIEVSLDEPYTEDDEAIAMPHQDTDGNEEYDFVDTEGDEDGPYTNADGDAVTDSASVTFETDDGDGNETQTDTPDDGETPTDTPTDEDGDGEDDQAGFGAVIALVALLGAALLAARRDAF